MIPGSCFYLAIIIIFSLSYHSASLVYLQNPSVVSIITPLKYDLTLQVPVNSDEHTGDPSFIGSLTFEFQLNHLAEHSKYSYTYVSQPAMPSRPSFPISEVSMNAISNDEQNPVSGTNRQDANNISRNITFDTLITETRFGAAGLPNFEFTQDRSLEVNSVTGSSVYVTPSNGSVKLSARNLTHFENVTLNSNSEKFTIIGIRSDENDVEFITDRQLPSGRYILHIEQYMGKFENSTGLYFRLAVELKPNL